MSERKGVKSDHSGGEGGQHGIRPMTGQTPNEQREPLLQASRSGDSNKVTTEDDNHKYEAPYAAIQHPVSTNLVYHTSQDVEEESGEPKALLKTGPEEEEALLSESTKIDPV
jgi:hypothetical protein